MLLVLLTVALLLSAVSASTVAQAEPSDKACWGQATKVCAQTGELDKHASQHDNPRFDLRNLARALYEAGVLGDDTMQALGEFVAAELGPGH